MSPVVKKVALALLGALAVVVAIRIALPGARVGRDSRPVHERAWKSAKVLGLTFQTPGRFEVITLPIPPEMRTQIARMESFGRSEGGTEMRVSRIRYLEGVPVSAQGSARGAVEALRAYQAVSQLQPAHAAAQVSGVPAIRSVLAFRMNGRPAHGEILTVLRGRTLWQFHVLGPADTTPGIARRILDSVRIVE
jgi:hypothetical protein